MRRLLLPVIFLLLAIFTAVIFIGGGYLISLVISLTLFQATIICIGSTFVLGFIIIVAIVALGIDEYRSKRGHDGEEYEYDEEEDNEDVEEETDNTAKRKIIDIKTEKIGRNEPCPCGSGKKHKFCCGK
jgi:preprotein translocase subunit SecA